MPLPCPAWAEAASFHNGAAWWDTMPTAWRSKHKRCKAPGAEAPAQALLPIAHQHIGQHRQIHTSFPGTEAPRQCKSRK